MGKSFGGEKWKSNVLLTSMLCPGVVFAHFFILNLVLWYYGSSAAIPFFTLVALLALWFGVSVPLTFVGAYFGFRKSPIEQPVRTNQIPRQIPDQSVYTQPIPGIIMGGVLPFGESSRTFFTSAVRGFKARDCNSLITSPLSILSSPTLSYRTKASFNSSNCSSVISVMM